MSQSTFSDLVDGVVNGVIEALANRESMTQARRDARAWIVREMVSGLHPGDVRQLMVASQAVLLQMLTIDAAGDDPTDTAATPRLRALSTVANLNRTMTKNLDVLSRLQTQAAKATPGEPPEEPPMPEPAISFHHVIDPAQSGPAAKSAPERMAAPPRVLNRQQKRQAERDHARLLRRSSGGQSADRISAQ